jgi:3'(2'), 5'-bisphosphate nucleotidase
VTLKSLGENQYEGLEEIVAIARTVGWGAADILQSYYRGDKSVGNLKFKTKKMGQSQLLMWL